MVHIANPIYDVVFKYLMEDSRIAKLLISKITGLKIIDLHFQPQEHVAMSNSEIVDSEIEVLKNITVYRLDFSARIKTTKGDKQVLIEIQKAKFPTDIMRFRKYLGEQYRSAKNTIFEKENTVHVALPIISIYFLGHKLKYVSAPVIKVNRTYIDMATGEEIKEREYFIESLTHDSFVIQIPLLKTHRRTELEQILSIFDQDQIDKDEHILNVKELDFPESYRFIIRRLQLAITEPKMLKRMDLEDEIIRELENKERHIAKLAKDLEDKNKALANKDKIVESQNKALANKDKIIEDLRKQLKK